MSSDQAAEVERLKQAVSQLQQKSAILAAAVAVPAQTAKPRVADEEPKAPVAVKAKRTVEQIQEDMFTELEARFVAEQDGSRDSVVATRTMQTELSAAPLNGARIAEIGCSASLCRATLEHDASAEPPDVAALIEASPSVRRESRFKYEVEGSLKRVTIYSARAGHPLNPPPADASTAL